MKVHVLATFMWTVQQSRWEERGKIGDTKGDELLNWPTPTKHEFYIKYNTMGKHPLAKHTRKVHTNGFHTLLAYPWKQPPV